MKLETEPRTQVRTNTDFVRHVEDTLGFALDLDSGKPPWKLRQAEAAKLKRKRAQKPGLYSMENLLLTVQWLRRRKQEVASPAAVCWFVEEALANAHSEPEPSDLEAGMNAAIAIASDRGDDYWVGRLTRAQGHDARLAVLAEWEAEHGG